MAKKQAEANRGPQKTGRGKRQATADENVAGPSIEAPATKRPQGRPPKASSGGPITPMPNVATPARNLRRAADVTMPEGEKPSARKDVAANAPRVTHTKRSRSFSPSSTSDTASEAPERHRSKKVSNAQSSQPRKRRTRSRRHVSSITSTSTTSLRSKRGKKRLHADSHSSTRHEGRHGKSRKAPSSRSSSVRGRRTRTGKKSKDLKKK
ncbi:hypothetical protein MRX96_013610 [Rhipicephalus microplus]